MIHKIISFAQVVPSPSIALQWIRGLKHQLFHFISFVWYMIAYLYCTMYTLLFSRYTEWVYYSSFPDFRPMWGAVYQNNSFELYDHQRDPEENQNVAFDKAYEKIRRQLSDQLHAGWRKALPGRSGMKIMDNSINENFVIERL